MVIANYVHTTGVTTTPIFNDGYSGYTTKSTNNGDGTTTVVMEHASTKPTSCRFNNASGLLRVNYIETSNMIDMSTMFLDCANLTYVNATNWATSSANTFNSLFKGCSKLAAIDGLNTWNTSKDI